MAISKAEAAMYAYITGRVLPKGTTRAVLRAAYKGAISAGTFVAGRVSPPVARGALGVGRATLGAGIAFGRRNPAVATGATLYALNEFGALEPIKETLAELNQAGMENLQQEFIQPAVEAGRKTKKRANKFAKAVGAGMKAIKKSASMGRKGVINAPKNAFSKVTKIASRINQAKKMKTKLPKRPKGKVDRLVYDITKKILGR